MDPCLEPASVELSGNRIHYRHGGSGPPALFLHGLVASGKNWDLNQPAIAAVRTTYALDLLNRGNSSRCADASASLRAEADRIIEFMDALRLSEVDIVAQSHGGAMALSLAARYPERVRRMVLFAPANPFCQNARALMRFYLSPVGTAFAQFIPVLPRWVKRASFRRVYVDPSKATSVALEGFNDSLAATSVRHILGIVRTWWPDMAELNALLPAAARTPTLLLWGDSDRVVSLASGRRLAAILGAELQVFPHAGHLPFAEQPALANAATIAFLTRP